MAFIWYFSTPFPLNFSNKNRKFRLRLFHHVEPSHILLLFKNNIRMSFTVSILLVVDFTFMFQRFSFGKVNSNLAFLFYPQFHISFSFNSDEKFFNFLPNFSLLLRTSYLLWMLISSSGFLLCKFFDFIRVISSLYQDIPVVANLSVCGLYIKN